MKKEVVDFVNLNNSEEQKPIEHSKKTKKNPSFLSEVIKFILLAFIIIVPIRTFIAQPFIVSGASMSPTFESGHYLIIDEISYRFNEPQRGDVIVFKYPKDTSKFFIKRIIGLPGETIEIINGNVFVSSEENPEPVQIDEVYVTNESPGELATTLGQGEYFVMGDNRPASLDSRTWGVLERKFIKGRAYLRLLPVTKAEVFPGALEDF